MNEKAKAGEFSFCPFSDYKLCIIIALLQLAALTTSFYFGGTMSHISKKVNPKIKNLDVLRRALEALGYQCEIALDDQNSLIIEGIGSEAKAMIKTAYQVDRVSSFDNRQRDFGFAQRKDLSGNVYYELVVDTWGTQFDNRKGGSVNDLFIPILQQYVAIGAQDELAKFGYSFVSQENEQGSLTVQVQKTGSWSW